MAGRPGRPGAVVTFDPGRLGVWSGAEHFDVRPTQVAAYAAATNEPAGPYREGKLTPPVFALLPAIDVYPHEIERLFGRTLSSLGSVHGEHDLLIDEPIGPLTTVTTRAAVTGVHAKASGTAVVVQTESRTNGGGLVNTQYAVQFLRGFDAGTSAGTVPPSWLARDAIRNEPPAANVTLRVHPDQSRRYAEASGDFGDYTLDDAAAHRAGFPRPILHGACTMALVGRAVTVACGGGDPARLRRLAVRFSAPCFPGDELTATVWELRDAVPRANVAFEVTDQEGRKVITKGLAEVSA
ncbi:MAG TPA: dehydratase [Actinobacteria bacterium]|nr:dehydratase [Actinomycetota bacterium]